MFGRERVALVSGEAGLVAALRRIAALTSSSAHPSVLSSGRLR
jgi:hypothetical protein